MTPFDLRELDWTGLHRRLAAADAKAHAAGPARGTPEANALLADRAKRLAQPAAQAPVGQADVLIFELAGERYGIESRYVQAVFVLRQRAPLPGAQPPIHGVTAWRGELLTLLELRATLGLPVDSLNDLARVIVLGKGKAAFGILTDAVHHIVPVDLARLYPPQEAAAGARPYLKGLTGDALLVLAPEHLLRLTEPESSRVE
jgi:purine-binding chemotaxis protein CheW